jgi:hypothetical protein
MPLCTSWDGRNPTPVIGTGTAVADCGSDTLNASGPFAVRTTSHGCTAATQRAHESGAPIVNDPAR